MKTATAQKLSSNKWPKAFTKERKKMVYDQDMEFSTILRVENIEEIG